MNTKSVYSLFLFIVSLILSACTPKNKVKHGGEKDLISFKPVLKTSYTEVSRRFSNGLSFNEFGYQMEPQWRLRFVSDDSASLYSPEKHRFINFPLTRGYDSIFNVARTWLKVRKMNSDSLVFELLKAYGDTIETKGVKTYMTFYADNYIKNALHSDTGLLKRPSRKDSLYITSLAELPNSDSSKAFPARHPASFSSKSHLITLKTHKVEGNFFNHFDTAEDYLSPILYITVHKAYADFYYSFSVLVDEKGQVHYGEPLIPFTDENYKKNYVHSSKAVLDSYLKLYLRAVPGRTLGLAHASIVSVHVEGKTGA
ncbi:MAG: hypothetical protein ACRYFB_15435 [Janthinobacterium lividum]